MPLSPPHRWLLLALLAGLASGCALEGKIRVAARFDPEQKSRLARGASFAVVVDPEAPAPRLHEDLATHIGAAMEGHGFNRVPVAEADLLVFFGFGTREEVRRTKLNSMWRTSVRSVYDHWLRIVVSDCPTFRETSGAQVIWAGEAILGEQLKRDPVESDEHAIETLERMCTETIAVLGKEKRPLAISFDHVQP